MKVIYCLFSSTIYVLFNSIQKILVVNCNFWWKFANFCTISFLKVFLKSFFEHKKNVYPVHTPAAVDYILFNFGEFLSISNFVWRAFIKQSSHHYGVKKDELLL
jgi:hypothetical protein